MLQNLLANDFAQVGTTLQSFLNQWWGPLLAVLGAASGILAIAAGIKYILAAQSGDEQKLKQAKNFIIGIFIGIAVVFLIAVLVPVIIAGFESWYGEQEMATILNRVFLG